MPASLLLNALRNGMMGPGIAQIGEDTCMARAITRHRSPAAAPAEWELSDLLRHPAQDSEQILKQLDQRVSQVESKRAALAADMAVEGFQEVLRLHEEIAAL